MPKCPECGAEVREGSTRCPSCGVELIAQPSEGAGGRVKPGPEWVEAGRYPTLEEAHLAKGLLLEREIASEVVDKHVVLNPFPQVDEAEVLLLVAPVDLERATAVLAEAEAGEDVLPEDADTGKDDT